MRAAKRSNAYDNPTTIRAEAADSANADKNSASEKPDAATNIGYLLDFGFARFLLRMHDISSPVDGRSWLRHAPGTSGSFSRGSRLAAYDNPTKFARKPSEIANAGERPQRYFLYDGHQVNPHLYHLPTMVGGNGRDEIFTFYRDHFVTKWPKDTSATRISRTIGEDQLVEELVMHFTHDTAIDALLPGVARAYRTIEFAGNRCRTGTNLARWKLRDE